MDTSYTKHRDLMRADLNVRKATTVSVRLRTEIVQRLSCDVKFRSLPKRSISFRTSALLMPIVLRSPLYLVYGGVALGTNGFWVAL